jgi:hypothetical protein
MRKKPWGARLREQSKRRKPGGTIGTIAFYGPDNRYARKVAVGILPEGATEVTILERWYEDKLDIRIDPRIGEEAAAVLRQHDVHRDLVADSIIGCPHE